MSLLSHVKLGFENVGIGLTNALHRYWVADNRLMSGTLFDNGGKVSPSSPRTGLCLLSTHQLKREIAAFQGLPLSATLALATLL